MWRCTATHSMYPYGVGKESFTQRSVLLYLKTEAEPVAETSCFFIKTEDKVQKKKERDCTNITFTLCIYALHDFECLTDVLVLQETSRCHVPVTVT